MEVPLGMTILEAEIQANLAPDAPCGGTGSCGKCLVKVDGKPVLACQTKVEKDCQVEIPGKKKRGKILSEGFSRNINFQPELRVKTVQLEKPKPGEKRSEWERLLEAVYGEDNANRDNDQKKKPGFQGGESWKGRKEYISPDVHLAGKLYERRSLGSGWNVIYTDNEILELYPDTKGRCNICTAAIDLGTTTIVGYLLDGKNGKTLAVESRMNPQVQYGADVIQRANYVLEHGDEGLSVLSRSVRETVNEILESLMEKVKNQGNGKEYKEACRTNIYQLSLVGNTCMHHLFLGIPPASLVHAPYTPAISQALTLHAGDYDIHIHRKGQLILLPNIAGYIGADTSGCLLALRQDLKEEITLMLDIGTNTEMILGNKDGLAACSAASGPAFEGAKIQCGMRGLPGAIDHVKYENGEWTYTTIGGEKPIGLCGSGLIDLVAELLRTGLLDENGILHSGQEKPDTFVLVPPEKTKYVSRNEDKYVIQADKTGEYKTETYKINTPYFESTYEVYLTQKDIGEVQLAKAAIAAGIQLLLKKMNVEESQVQTVYLAGGFGNYMNAENAARIGLIPESFVKKVQCVGNAAGEGAKIALLNKKERHEIEDVVEKIEFLELAACPEFQDCFIDELGFEYGKNSVDK